MDRRNFLKASGAAAIGAAVGGCATGVVARSGARRPVDLVPVDVSWDRIIRTTVGLRPHRPSGFVVRAERLDDRTLIHNYGHGGAGMSLSWGTGMLAAELALEQPERTAAVIGCGVVGLTAARQLQRRGFNVTIYASALPPETTSNMSLASFTPTSGLVARDRRTPEWDAQFRRAVETAYRDLQLLVGARYGISWLDEYSQTNTAVGAGQVSPAGNRGATPGRQGNNALLPAGIELARELLQPGEHPFASRYARRMPTMRFEPSIYLEALMRDVITFGGRIVVRSFDTPRDLMTLSERLLINCTGLGAKALFGDDELTPVKGQLVVLVPQPEVTYATGTMVPRSDGIVLGHLMLPGVWSLDVEEAERVRVVENHIRFFSSMRPPRIPGRPGPPAPPAPPAATRAMADPPPVEAFFDRES